MSSASDIGRIPAPMSPCISICALGVDGQCSGCLRTRDEIAGWIRMTPAQQWALLRELDRRRAARGAGGG
ncbi:MAG: DUF1289 domain-containing protein [Steroidobacteraceae bacterium]|jgi:hypothetical protein|nr:DUF1289 domain-containing protein [Steroidobacteraceae bacterium]